MSGRARHHSHGTGTIATAQASLQNIEVVPVFYLSSGKTEIGGIMPGGKRKGAGRPPGSTIENPKVYVAARISSQVATWLNKQKNKSRVIETALNEYKERIED